MAANCTLHIPQKLRWILVKARLLSRWNTIGCSSTQYFAKCMVFQVPLIARWPASRCAQLQLQNPSLPMQNFLYPLGTWSRVDLPRFFTRYAIKSFSCRLPWDKPWFPFGLFSLPPDKRPDGLIRMDACGIRVLNGIRSSTSAECLGPGKSKG